ncbi:MAG: restriction endonuclease subunit S [Planctomycetaceae bacterium]
MPDLGEVVELKRGYDLPQRLREEGDVPIISSSGFSGPGVVTGRYGTVGEVHWGDKDYWPSNTALYVRDFNGNDEKFIYYFLHSIDYYSYSDKAAVPEVNPNHLHQAEVCVPPLGALRARSFFNPRVGTRGYNIPSLPGLFRVAIGLRCVFRQQIADSNRKTRSGTSLSDGCEERVWGNKTDASKPEQSATKKKTAPAFSRWQTSFIRHAVAFNRVGVGQMGTR